METEKNIFFFSSSVCNLYLHGWCDREILFDRVRMCFLIGWTSPRVKPNIISLRTEQKEKQHTITYHFSNDEKKREKKKLICSYISGSINRLGSLQGVATVCFNIGIEYLPFIYITIIISSLTCCSLLLPIAMIFFFSFNIYLPNGRWKDSMESLLYFLKPVRVYLMHSGYLLI